MQSAGPKPWLRLTRRGNTFATSVSDDGESWKPVDAREFHLPTEALWGVAAWVPGNMALGEVVFDSVKLIPGRPYATYAVSSPFVSRGVVLVDGTQIAAEAIRLADGQLHLTRGSDDLKVSLAQVAWIVFNPVGPQTAARVGQNRGIVLSGGEVLQGDLAGIDNGTASFSTVVFGNVSYAIETQVAAVSLQDVHERPAAYTVIALDGSSWPCERVTIADNNVVLTGSVPEGHTLPTADIATIIRNNSVPK
jgi:hypothetical protein